MKIWCVEDDASIRDIEVYTLNSTGYEAQGFADGAAFFAALARGNPCPCAVGCHAAGRKRCGHFEKIEKHT